MQEKEGVHRDIEIDRSKCVVCGACIAVCPVEALVIEGLTLVVHPERCRPCGQAAYVCPTGAIRCPESDRERSCM
jgi:electron transfer flavoprotein alpha subunit